MDYPREFSPEARAYVEAERLRAIRAYEQRRGELPAGYGHMAENEENLRHFILRVFLAFARQACKFAEDGIWPVDKVRSQADEFLRRFTIQAYYDYGQDRGGHKLPEMTSNWGHLRSEIERKFRESQEWHDYEDELLAVAEKIAKRSTRKAKRSDDLSTTRRAMIESFIAKMAEQGHKISKKDIWTVANYEEATEFERFQRGSSRTTQAAVLNFTRVLSMKSEDFIKALQKHRSR
jgi:hypothetical protein